MGMSDEEQARLPRPSSVPIRKLAFTFFTGSLMSADIAGIAVGISLASLPLIIGSAVALVASVIVCLLIYHFAFASSSHSQPPEDDSSPVTTQALVGSN